MSLSNRDTKKIERDRLQKSMAALLVILLVGLISIFYVQLFQGSRFISEINSVHLPILERSAINLLLNETVSYKLEKSIDNNAFLEDYFIEREALESNIVEYDHLIHSLRSDLNIAQLSRSELNEMESEIIKKIEKRRLKEAKEMVSSLDYLQLKLDFREKNQSLAEDLAHYRENVVAAQEKYLKQGVGLSISLTVSILLLFGLFWRSYRRGREEQQKSRQKLEEEKSRNIHNSKLVALGEMAGGVAHEINNPLSIILMNAEIIERSLEQDDGDLERALKCSKKIQTTSTRIAKIIRGLRRLSRNSESDPNEIIDIGELIEDCVSLSREKFNSRKIDIRVNVEKRIRTSGKAVELGQVFLNLLSNSYDAISDLEERWIKIHVYSCEEGVAIDFEDSGTGIAPEIVEKIFDPFFTTKEVGSGTGLGLSISRGILNDHGGNIHIDGRSPNTKFHIVLPSTKNENAER